MASDRESEDAVPVKGMIFKAVDLARSFDPVSRES